MGAGDDGADQCRGVGFTPGGDLVLPVASAALSSATRPTASRRRLLGAFVGVESATMRCRSVGATVFARTLSDRHYYVPTAEGFDAAVRAGLGWGCSLTSSLILG